MRSFSMVLVVILACLTTGTRTGVASGTAGPTSAHLNREKLHEHANRTAAAGTISLPSGSRLEASPAVVDVGGSVELRVLASAWPSSVGVQVSFLSAHHGFSGPMPWNARCACFTVSVSVARRVHSLELARVTARLRFRGKYFLLFTRFQIRGLATNGRQFAPGGQTSLTAWVSDPRPLPNEYQHFCASVQTVDGLGVPHIPVTFAVTYAHRHENWKPVFTDPFGVACVHRRLGHPDPGHPVLVEASAAGEHARTSFTPRT